MIGEEEINEDWFLLDVEQAIDLIRVQQLGRLQAESLVKGLEHYQEAHNLGEKYTTVLNDLRKAVEEMPKTAPLYPEIVQNPLD
tara:strand:- start:2301 stop:2552 length:252 start_codon:yes stop_codon:yes gene_type:complete